MHMKHLISSMVLVLSTLIVTHCTSTKTQHTMTKKTLKALIIDGENNHGTWPKTTAMMKDFIQQTGLFEVDVIRKKYIWQGPHADEVLGAEKRIALLDQYPINSNVKSIRVDDPQADSEFSPAFEDYDVVISNLGWKASPWPEATKRAFETYMQNGGGLVIVHAANNSFGDWSEFNKMIGLGGWGGRNTESGPYVYYDDNGQLVRDLKEGACGSHGPRYEFVVETRAPQHPIMRGLPMKWLHAKDELYDRLRGPAEDMTILATAYSDVEKNPPPWAKEVLGTGRHEPMLMAIDYGEGRVFHTGLGHNDYSMECVGFITTLQRGVEWAASGKVTQRIPADFPGISTVSTRSWSD